jgi:hypothetical protein
MRPIFFGFLIAFLLNLGAGGQSPASRTFTPVPAARMQIRLLPPEKLHRVVALHESLQPSAKAWIVQQARIEAQRPAPDLPALRAAIRLRFAGSRPDNATVEAAVALVLFQMAKDRDPAMVAQISQESVVEKEIHDLQELADLLGQEDAQAKANHLTGDCQSYICMFLPGRFAQLNAASAQLPHPIHLQAPMNLTYEQLATVKANIIMTLVTFSLDNQPPPDLAQNQQNAQNAFQQADQKTSQLTDILSGILKTMNEEQGVGVQGLK